MPEAKPKVNCPAIAADDEADKGPATFRLEATLDEAEEINPETVSRLAKLVAPETDNVDEAERGPAIERLAAMLDEAETIRLARTAIPEDVALTTERLVTVEDDELTKMPPLRVLKPPAVRVPLVEMLTPMTVLAPEAAQAIKTVALVTAKTKAKILAPKGK